MKTSFALPLLLLGLAPHGAIALAQSPGTFTPTGAMTTPRSWHTATLLTNGKVLIAGGSLGFNPLATAELYDPDSGTFTPTGSMTTPRMAHSATLLPSGRVLMAGGSIIAGQGIIPSNSAEIYDPSTGTFTPTGNLISDHACQQATLLGNGRVLIAGGDGPNGRVPRAEVYEPATGSFATTGTYASDISGFNSCDGAALTLLPDGRVLVVWEEHAAELYDPDAGLFTSTGRPLTQSYNDGLPSATLLMNGKVLVAGGANDSGIRNTAEIFDSSTANFTATGAMSTGHALHTATLLGDGSVLIAGTYGFGGGALASTDVYDPVAGMFRSAGSMIVARSLHTATLLNNGRVLLAGGDAGANISISRAEIYTPSAVVSAPVLLSLSNNGQGQGAILHAGTARVATGSEPASPGEVLEIYGTGLNEGSVIPPQIAIDGRLAEILYFGNAPGFTGLNQMNVRVPTGVGPGSAVPVRLIYLNRPSNAVTIGVR
jgi:Kelch motif